MGWKLVLAMALMTVTTITALDTSDVVEELPEGILSRAGDALLSSESAWSEGASESVSDMLIQGMEDEVDEYGEDIDFLALQSKSGIEQQQALAELKIVEDKAALQMSGHAQDLEQLKGQMSVEVIKAKADLKQNPRKGSPHAKLAANIAKQVLAKSKVLQSDKTKEKMSKLNVKKASDLMALDKENAKAVAKTKKAAQKQHDKMKAGEKMGAGDDAKIPAKGSDSVSNELITEMKKWKGLSNEEGKAADDNKNTIATLETSVQSFTEKLAKAKTDLLKSQAELKRHAAKHHNADRMYKVIKQKESHHKKSKALAAKIQKQEDQLRVQKMKIASSKEQLNKSMQKKEVLDDTHTSAISKIHPQAQKKAKTTGAPGKVNMNPDAKASLQHIKKEVSNLQQGTPAVNAAVDAVSANLQQQDIEKQLAPKIAKLQTQLSGADLKQAVDQLVAATVATKVKTAFTQDPKVAKAVHAAVGQVRVHHARQESTRTQLQAENTLRQVDEASKNLEQAGSQFEAETDSGLAN